MKYTDRQTCREASKILTYLYDVLCSLHIVYPYPHYLRFFSALKAEYHKRVLGAWFQDFNICYIDGKYSPSQCSKENYNILPDIDFKVIMLCQILIQLIVNKTYY
jgi:hypothetical protein